MIISSLLLITLSCLVQLDAQGHGTGPDGYSIQIRYCDQSCRGHGCLCQRSSRCDNFRRSMEQDSHIFIMNTNNRFCMELGHCDRMGICSPKMGNEQGQEKYWENLNNCNLPMIDCTPMSPNAGRIMGQMSMSCSKNPYCEPGHCQPDGKCGRFKNFSDKDNCDLCIRTMGGMCNEAGVCVVHKSPPSMMMMRLR